MNFTIRQLRRAGFKVRVIHTRHYETTALRKMSGYATENRLSGKGGTTRIQITTPDGQVDVEGIAVCSLEDSFNRKLGNSIAIGRAIQRLELYPEVKDLLLKIKEIS